MEQNKEYFAFISYQRQDEEWAKWLAHELEHYHFPITLNGRSDLPNDLRPIFRDVDELSAGNLPSQIHRALSCSKHLIVICSPNSAKSPWVNKEIEEFTSMGKTDKIFPFIIEGKAFSKDPEEECFPLALRSLPNEDERLGGNINEMGRDAAVVKTVAGMLNLEFDTLWQRYEREKAEEEQRKREERDYLLTVQSHYLSEKAKTLVGIGDTYLASKIVLEALPKSLDTPNRPYVSEADAMLRTIVKSPRTGKIKNSCGEIVALAFEPNGECFIALSRDATITKWNIRNGRCLQKYSLPIEYVTYAAFSSDRKYLLSRNNDTKIAGIWEVDTGILVKSFDIRTKKNHNNYDGIGHACFCKDGNIVACALNSSIHIFNQQSGEKTVVHSPSSVFAVALSPNGETLAVGCFDNTVRVWNVKSNSTFTLTGHTDTVGSLSFSSNGEYLASGSYDHTVKIWEVTSGKCLKTIAESNGSINHLVFSSDCQLIIAASEDSNYYVLDSQSGLCYIKFNYHTTPVKCTAISSDSLKIVSASERGIIHTLDFSDENPHKLLYWTPDTDMARDLMEYATYSHDCKYILSCTSYGIWGLWDSKTEKRILTILGNNTSISPFSFSTDNRYILIPRNKEIHFFDFKKDRWTKVLRGHSDIVQSAYFSHNGQFVISTSADSSIRVWDVDTAQCVHTIHRKKAVPRNAIFSPNGNNIAFFENENLENNIHIIDLSTKRCNQVLVGHRQAVTSISYSKCGKYLASASVDMTIRIWDTSTAECLLVLEGHTGSIHSVSFSHDSKYLVSASNDKTIRIWDMTTGICLDILKGHRENVLSAFFHLDGRHILSASQDNTICIWNFPDLQQLIDNTRMLFSECPMAPEEKMKYHIQ